MMEDKYTFFLGDHFRERKFTAPVILGEFKTYVDDFFWDHTIRYLKETPELSWSYYTLEGFGNQLAREHSPLFSSLQSDYGILKNDFMTVDDHWKLDDLQSVMEKEPEKEITYEERRKNFLLDPDMGSPQDEGKDTE